MVFRALSHQIKQNRERLCVLRLNVCDHCIQDASAGLSRPTQIRIISQLSGPN